jgi:two-component system, cell cycle sensor histidine kinase and response regulator CckA
VAQDENGRRKLQEYIFRLEENQDQAEEALKISQEEYKTLFENSRRGEEVYRSLINSSADAIIIYDMDGFCNYVSPSFTETFGWRLTELKGKRIEFVPESEKEATMRHIHNLIDNGIPCQNFETKRYRKDGQLLAVSLSASRYKDHDGNSAGMLVVIRDISEKKRLEAQFWQAQKMKAVGTLAGGVAHDFNNLLMGIQGRVSLMLMEVDSEHPFCQHLKEIEEYIKSAAGLARQLLSFARGGKYEVKPANPNEIVAQSAHMFGRTRKEIAIHQNYQQDIWTVDMDRSQIEQVLLNLYLNAWHAMSEGGELYISTENVDLDEAYVSPYEVKPGHYVKISVTDTGAGMDKETLERIFEPFFTTKEMGRGTGLGLATVYGIIKNHGGFVNVYSEKGHGTTFNQYLPASDKQVSEEPEPIENLLEGKETILLVDDEELIIETVKELLTNIGYDTLVALGGRDAIAVYEKNKDHIHMVILDLIMPDMGGGAVYDRLKEIKPDVKVLLSSGYSIGGAAQEMLDRGCNDFIQKPFNLSRLSQKIRKLLDQD